MDQVLKPVRPEDANHRAIRNSRAHYRARQASEAQAEAAETRQPSYLQTVRQSFDQLWENGDGDIARTWVVDQIRQSYWNGVEHGATGKVKPKGERA